MSEHNKQERLIFCYICKKHPTDPIEKDFVQEYGVCLGCDETMHDDDFTEYYQFTGHEHEQI